MDRILTLDELYTFCESQNISHFSAENFGSSISIHIPSTFEVEDVNNEEGLLHLKIRLLHTGVNRKGRCVSKESAEKYMNSFKNRPVLADIHRLDNGEWDFGRHAFEIKQDENGEPFVEYIEKQVGSITEKDLFFEVDPDTGKEYLCGYAVVPEYYTKAADILRSKQGVSKSSCELTIKEMEYHADEHYLDLVDWCAMGLTLLGRTNDGEIIQEGMEGCQASIIEEGRNGEMENTNIDGNSEVFEEEEVVVETSEEESSVVEEMTETEVETEDVATENEEKFSYTFELSHSDIRCGLYQSLDAKYANSDSYCYIESVFNDYFVYTVDDNTFGQKYTVVDNVVSFIGKEYKLIKEILTEEEHEKLNEMRNNYDNIRFELEKYKAEPEKIKILESNEYASVADLEEFKKLKDTSAHFDMSVDEVSAKADAILLDFAKSEWTDKADDTVVNNKKFGAGKKKAGRYGDLFRR